MTERFNSELVRGSLDLMVLSVLADGPKYGYLIQKRIVEASHERVKLPAGTMYPLLHRLESDRLIRARWDRTSGRHRKWYELTAAGAKRLRHQAHEWQEYVACLRDLLKPVLGASPKPA